MPNQTVSTDKAPKAIGPYSQGIVAGDLVFVSGQIPLDPQTQQMVQGDVRAQTERVMENLGAVLAAAGGGFANVVKASIFLADLNDVAAVNDTFEKLMGPDVEPRKKFIQAHAKSVRNLDI